MSLIFNKKDYHKYIKDSLFDSENYWYWKWKRDRIVFLHSKCSKCSTNLLYDENKSNNIVYFYCPNCQSEEMCIKAQSYLHSQDILKREIKRKVFTKNT